MPLLTVREVAAELGVSRNTVLRWASAGKLPHIRLPGGALRFDPDEIKSWIADHHEGSGEAQT